MSRSLQDQYECLLFQVKKVLFDPKAHDLDCMTHQGAYIHCECSLMPIAYESGWNTERENSEPQDRPDTWVVPPGPIVQHKEEWEIPPALKLETQQANEAGEIIEPERGLFDPRPWYGRCPHGPRRDPSPCPRCAEDKPVIRGIQPGESQEEIALRGTGAAKHPVDGWVNVYAGCYSLIWADERSAKAAADDSDHAYIPIGNPGPFLRTVRIAEVRPGFGLYSQEQVDVMIAQERNAINRSAGRSLMDMLHGVRDVSKKGGGTAEQVMNSQERAIEALQTSLNRAQAESVAERAKNAELQAQLASFEQRLKDLVNAMTCEGEVNADD